MTKILFLMLILSSVAFAEEPAYTPAITSEKVDTRVFVPRKSHWIATYGFEGMKYNTRSFDFRGHRKNIFPKNQELYGGRIGVGGELYLGGGLMTTSRVEGYYQGTLFSSVQSADPEAKDVTYAYYKRTGQVMGVDLTQSLSMIIDFKAKNPFLETTSQMYFEPFVEAGIGAASAFNKVNYFYNTQGASSGGIKEFYKASAADKLVNARIGAGFNITAATGFFLYLRATINRYHLMDRKITGYTQSDTLPYTNLDHHEKSSDVRMNPVTIYALGGGYKF